MVMIPGDDDVPIDSESDGPQVDNLEVVSEGDVEFEDSPRKVQPN